MLVAGSLFEDAQMLGICYQTKIIKSAAQETLQRRCMSYSGNHFPSFMMLFYFFQVILGGSLVCVFSELVIAKMRLCTLKYRKNLEHKMGRVNSEEKKQCNLWQSFSTF